MRVVCLDPGEPDLAGVIGTEHVVQLLPQRCRYVIERNAEEILEVSALSVEEIIREPAQDEEIEQPWGDGVDTHLESDLHFEIDIDDREVEPPGRDDASLDLSLGDGRADVSQDRSQVTIKHVHPLLKQGTPESFDVSINRNANLTTTRVFDDGCRGFVGHIRTAHAVPTFLLNNNPSAVMP